MRDYEIVAFIQEKPGEADPAKEAGQLVSELVKQQGGSLTKLETPGRRALGYLVKGQKEAQFVLFHVRLEPDKVDKLARAFRLNMQVLTSMITLKKAEPSAQPSTEARPVKKPTRGKVRV